MGGFAFLIMLGSYGIVLYWYALNHERDEDGKDGILGIRPYDPLHMPRKRMRPGHVLLKMRGNVPKHGVATTSADAVRARAARIDPDPELVSRIARRSGSDT